MEINGYGLELIRIFTEETTTMKNDIESGTFLGTMFYEDHIHTIQDAAAWMLETYDVNAIYIVDDWRYNFGNNWYVPLDELRKELELCFE